MASNSKRLEKCLEDKTAILSIFTTAGYPNLNSIVPVCKAIQTAGAKMIEIGFPFSDPIADGQTIQKSNERAIQNGMNLEVLFSQLKDLRNEVSLPVLLMGYLNPVIQYGIDKFIKDAKEVGIDGLILPDLPIYEFKKDWQEKLKQAEISYVFLVTPQTSEARIREIDSLSDSFIYAVSSQAVTGAGSSKAMGSEEYYQYLASLKLKHPVIVGFGIFNKETFELATKHHKGAIIGSAFINCLEKSKDKDIDSAVREFINTII